MADAPRSRRSRRWLLVALLALLLLLVLADVAAQAAAERRLAEGAAETTGLEITADVRGRPFLLRATVGTLAEVRLDGRAHTAAPGRVARAALRLEQVDVAAGQLLRTGVLDLAAPAGRLEVDFADGYRPLGLARLRADLDDIAAELTEVGSTLAAATLVLADDEGRVDAVADAVDVDHDERRTTTVVQLADVRADLAGDGLPMEVAALDLRAGALEIRRRASSTEVTGDAVVLAARDVPVDDLGVRARRLDVDLPSVRVDHDGAALGDTRTPGGRFDVVLGQDAVDGLWDFPGAVVLRDGSARLEVAGIGLDLRVRADAQGRVAIEPIIPGLLAAVLPDLGIVAFPPPLPAGMDLDGVEVREGELVLRGRAEQWTLPQAEG